MAQTTAEPTVEPTEAETARSEAEQNPSGNDDRSNLLRKAYGNATTRLREQYRDEFDALYVQEAQALGVDYKPRPTAEQRAKQQLEALLEEYPHLREQIAG